jgi:hypothetical protein
LHRFCEAAMSRRSPAYAQRITVVVEWVAAPASHFTPLLALARDLGYFDPKKRTAAVTSDAHVDDAQHAPESKTQP